MFGEKWAEPGFNAIAFYLHVAGMSIEVTDVDMLADEEL
jgi:hypothetical protein